MRRTTKTRVDKFTGKLLRPGEYAKAPGKYEYRHTDERTGETTSVYAKTIEALRRRESELKREVGCGLDRSSRRMTLDEVHDEYVREKVQRKLAAGMLRQSTANHYERMYGDYIRGTALGRRPVKTISRHDVEDYYLDLLSKGYAANTLEGIQGRLGQTLDYAVERHYVKENVARGAITQIVKQARVSQKAKRGALRRCLTPEQRDLLVSTMSENDRFRHYLPIVRFLLHTGLRAGELAGLRADDICCGVLHVQRTLVYQKDKTGGSYEYCVNPPKTACSNREIRLPKAAIKDLEDWRSLGTGPAEEACGVTDFVFCSQRWRGMCGGKPLTVGTLGNMLKKVAQVANEAAGSEVIPAGISPHWLRHTFVCDAIDAGIPATAVAKLVGHESETITMGVYYECRPHVVEEAVDALDRLFERQEKGLRLVA